VGPTSSTTAELGRACAAAGAADGGCAAVFFLSVILFSMKNKMP